MEVVVPQDEKERVELSEKIKEEANKLFIAHHHQQALDKYTEAIKFNPNNPILFGNRAFAHIKLESYGCAIEDATKALELDKTFVKGYYRRGSAFLALGKYKEGYDDFKEAAKIKPRDPDVRKRFKECEKAYKEARLRDAIGIDHTPHSVLDSLGNIEDLVVEPSYDGPHLGEQITLEFVKQMMEHFRNQKRLHSKYMYKILIKAKGYFASQPSLVRANFPQGGKFTVFGDIHGQYYDLLNIFYNVNGLPSETNPCLFNGDFVDRGSFSVEVILTLLAFKLLYPNHVFLNRGNHEAQTMNKVYGFEGEVRAKYTPTAYDLFSELFCCLPLAHVINDKVLVVHGGLFSTEAVSLEDIRKIERLREPPDSGLMCELLWADPQEQPGRAPSKRGVGLSFGPDVTQRFLSYNNLDLLIRSHECKDNGYQVDHGGKCITVFSAPNYCDQIGNKGAIVVFRDNLKPDFVPYEAVPHPKVPPMAYVSNFSGLFM